MCLERKDGGIRSRADIIYGSCLKEKDLLAVTLMDQWPLGQARPHVGSAVLATTNELMPPFTDNFCLYLFSMVMKEPSTLFPPSYITITLTAFS